jgi:hypothetical protein
MVKKTPSLARTNVRIGGQIMRVIGAVAVPRLRARWRAWAALVLPIGLAGGAVLAE